MSTQLRTRFDELPGWSAEPVIEGFQIYDQERFSSPVGFYNSDNHTLQMNSQTSDRLTSTEPGRELQSSKPVPCNGLHFEHLLLQWSPREHVEDGRIERLREPPRTFRFE